MDFDQLYKEQFPPVYRSIWWEIIWSSPVLLRLNSSEP